MSIGHSSASLALGANNSRVPWQYRVHPALFVTICSIVATLLLVGMFVLTRRFSGAITADLSPGFMLALALITALAITFARVAWRRNFPLETPADLSLTDQLLGWGSSAALAFLAVGCCYPAYRNSDWLIWLPVLVADQLWRQNFFDAGQPWLSAEDQDHEFSTLSLDHAAQINEPTISQPELKNIVQQLFRLQDEQELEIIYGTVRADFVPGQRTAVIHVGFCPPLTYIPEIEAEALPGSRAKTKVVQALSHGTRLEVRLPTAATAGQQVWIDMAARPVGAREISKSA